MTDTDLTVNMRRALWQARSNGGSLRIGSAQPGGGMDKRSAYALERRGLVTINRNDFRERVATLTDAGREVVA